MAERAAHNRPVGGSSPPAPTRGVLLVLLLIATLTQFHWKPYEFKDRETYRYTYREVFRGEVRVGGFTVQVSRTSGGYRVRIRGFYHRWEGSVERVFKDAEELAGFILIRMYFDHWLIPLGRTILSRGLVRTLRGREVDWSLGEREVEKGVVRRVVPCRAGGLGGRMLVVEERGVEVLKICVHEEASLPIYMLRRNGEGNEFEIRLVRYSSDQGNP